MLSPSAKVKVLYISRPRLPMQDKSILDFTLWGFDEVSVASKYSKNSCFQIVHASEIFPSKLSTVGGARDGPKSIVVKQQSISKYEQWEIAVHQSSASNITVKNIKDINLTPCCIPQV